MSIRKKNHKTRKNKKKKSWQKGVRDDGRKLTTQRDEENKQRGATNFKQRKDIEGEHTRKTKVEEENRNCTERRINSTWEEKIEKREKEAVVFLTFFQKQILILDKEHTELQKKK